MSSISVAVTWPPFDGIRGGTRRCASSTCFAMSLATLPESFAKLTSITDYLYLHDNRLQVLSDSVTSISATIRSVDFPFRWTPQQITRARPGKYRTKTLLRFLANLTALDELTLRNNRLSSQPDSFENLRKLCHLDHRGNEFTTFSEVLRALPKLLKLDLRWSVCSSNLGEVVRARRFPGRSA